MVASDPADALQAGLYALLSADATLAGLVSGVYDGPPEDAALDYVAIGEMSSGAAGTHDGEGRATTAVLHTWTRAASHRPGNVIGARLVALLTHRHADLDGKVTGHTVWRVAHDFAQTLVDPDEPALRHRVDHFVIWTAQT